MILRKFTVSGHSMQPYLQEGDHVLSLNFLRVRKGDVIVFKQDNKYLIKRIKKIAGKEYLLAGDNKKDSLEIKPIQKNDIIGKVVFKF